MTKNLTPEEEQDRKVRLVKDLRYYAANCLVIKNKVTQRLEKFQFNQAQAYLHSVVERQLAERGYVRIIICKGRQQGVSSYIEARAFHKTTTHKGHDTFILTHHSDSTRTLFEMSTRFYRNLPKHVKPSADKDSQNQLHFDRLDSGFKVGTAGAEEVGRGMNTQFLHGSEVAFWPNSEKIAKGLMETVLEGTGEIFLESTSDGPGNYFHKQVESALTGETDFEVVFLPWVWQSEYRMPVPDGFVRTDDEHDYAELIRESWGIEMDDEQLMFRRNKIAKLDSEAHFVLEYPATLEQAFEASGVDNYFDGAKVRKAMARDDIQPMGPAVLGVDCARFGNDETVIYARQGRVARLLFKGKGLDQVDIAGRVATILRSHTFAACFIDVGHGIGVIDILRNEGFDEVVEVDFGSKALDQDRFKNKRNEIYGELKDWLDGHVHIQNDKVTYMDLMRIVYTFDPRGRKVLLPKDKIKDKLGKSPDRADALALTFGGPVHVENEEDYFDTGQHHRGRDEATGY